VVSGVQAERYAMMAWYRAFYTGHASLVEVVEVEGAGHSEGAMLEELATSQVAAWFRRWL
jgi:hypothetical protein